MSKTRKQHYVPVSYLERFTSKGKIYTLDIVKQRTLKTSPKEVAHIRDFYSVDLEDDSKEDVIEKYFSKVEGNAKPILEQWIKTMKPPAKKEWQIISEFIAGMSLRVPEFRKKQLEMHQYMTDLMNHYNLSSKEAYERSRKRYHQDTGKELKLEYEEIKHIYENPALYQDILHQNDYISTMMKCLPGIANIIFNMTPLLFINSGKYRFITSDNPAIMIDGDRKKPSYMGCGWLTKTVEVYFPISPFTCIVLIWGKEYLVVPTNDNFVPSVNSYQLWFSTRYVFSESENIYWQKDGKIYCDNDLLFKELSHTKSKTSSTIHGPIPQVERPFDLNLIRKSSYGS